MDTDYTENEKEKPTISILSNHQTLLNSLSGWLYHRYPGCNLNTSSKDITRLPYLDNNHKNLVIIDFGLSFSADLNIINTLNFKYPGMNIIAIIPFKKEVLSADLKDINNLKLIPKWEITAILPRLINSILGTKK